MATPNHILAYITDVVLLNIAIDKALQTEYFLLFIYFFSVTAIRILLISYSVD